MRAWKGELGSSLKGVLPKWHGSFQVRLTPSVIPSQVEESLILTITSSKRCLDCARHDKKPIWATRPLDAPPFSILFPEPIVTRLRSMGEDRHRCRPKTLRFVY